MKIDGKECKVEQAYDALAQTTDVTILDKIEATPAERESFVTYASLRSHRDYLRDLDEARRGVR